MTHEEALTFHMAREVRSYRDLPLMLYHFQTKERDEPRPRAGRAAHARVHHEGLLHLRPRRARASTAPTSSTSRPTTASSTAAGLEWYRVESDVGMMGGIGAHEYMAPCAAGRERGRAVRRGLRRQRGGRERRRRSRSTGCPSRSTRPSRSRRRARRRSSRSPELLGVPAGALIKAMPMIVEGRGPVLVLVRGDHRLNEIKLQNALGAPARPAERGRGARGLRRRAGLHRAGRARGWRWWPTRRCAGSRGLVAGANEPDLHLRGVEPGRDFEPDLGRRPHGRGGRHAARTAATIRIEPAIEVGNIFKLGTRYSEPLGATYLDEQGNEQPIWMGSYGIGPARIMAAAVEQYADEQGISWPRSLAPVRRRAGDARASRARRRARSPSGSTRSCARPASTCSTTTATASPGEKFADAELLGCPLRLTVGKQGVEAGEVEAQVRRGQEKRSLPLEGAADGGRGAVARAPLTRRRLLGLDRSGPPPPETLRRQPLNPWTIPNAIGFVRLALIPVFLVLALSAPATAATRAASSLYAVIALDRLPRRDGRAHHRPVQPPRRAARPAHRPPAGDLGRGRLLALRAAAALGARGAGRARAVHARADPASRSGAGSTSRSTCSAAGRSGRRCSRSSWRWSSTPGSPRRCSTSAWR